MCKIEGETYIYERNCPAHIRAHNLLKVRGQMERKRRVSRQNVLQLVRLLKKRIDSLIMYVHLRNARHQNQVRHDKNQVRHDKNRVTLRSREISIAQWGRKRMTRRERRRSSETSSSCTAHYHMYITADCIWVTSRVPIIREQ